ncbi:DUF2934 domain-containing protein [Fontimonas sp. SYSU GA230001]|uniref:DUF2934 domain-containing protein n=1 Tax=Fontimonas sp. SYSU GA230001 TaxID=3142450 RepID=UPI0032B4189E
MSHHKPHAHRRTRAARSAATPPDRVDDTEASAQATGPGARPDGELRERMIAEAAYYRALNRGFNGGDPNDDWFAAEREIDERFGIER